MSYYQWMGICYMTGVSGLCEVYKSLSPQRIISLSSRNLKKLFSQAFIDWLHGLNAKNQGTSIRCSSRLLDHLKNRWENLRVLKSNRKTINESSFRQTTDISKTSVQALSMTCSCLSRN